MIRKAILFANPRSGAANRFPEARDALARAGIEIESARFDLKAEAVATAVREATDSGIGLVVAFGGDGTIGSVVNGIVGHDVTLALIAAGTSNNFARSLAIRPTVTSSVAAIHQSREVTIDLGEVNGLYFAHAAIMGLNVDFARHAETYRRYLGRLTYPLASLMVYGAGRKLALTVAGDGETRRFDTYQLALMNSGLIRGAPEARTSPGAMPELSLRAVTVDDLRLRTMLGNLPRIFYERHLGLPGGSGFDVTQAEITAPRPIAMTLDGEIRTATPATVRVVPRALRVIAGSGWRGSA